MPKPGLTTTDRGYGHQHQQARAQALATYHPRQTCTRCGQPLGTTNPKLLHLDHTDDRTAYLGLAHATCNTRAGQAKAMARRKPRARRSTKRSRNW